MRVTLFDDSIPFDAYMPGGQPLGGAEKAFASLPGALARRGHQVTVFNRCRYRMSIEGAQWEAWDAERPLQTDVLIAFRKPPLLTAVRQVGRRVLWLAAPAGYLQHPANRRILDDTAPDLVFFGFTHHATWAGGKLRASVIPPGLRPDYMAEEPTRPAGVPRAIVTTHPLHGLDWLLRLWCERIHPACPEAELHVYSMALDKAQLGGECAQPLKPVLAQALAARERGVTILRPKGDLGMAADYRAARVHLYPGHADDMACFTLMESQACGLPAVARPLGAVRERVRDGETGYVVPDDDAFANVAVQLLTNDEMFWSLNQGAHASQRERGWDAVAADFEVLFAGGGP